MSFKKILSAAAGVLLIIVIVLAAVFTFTTLATRDVNNVSSFLGYTPLTVQSDSMAPTFHQGDLLVIRKVDPASLNEGDIITFNTIIEGQFALNTHRIVEIEEGQNGFRIFHTQGDNNAIEDSGTIGNGDIIGKMAFKIGGLGKVMDFLKSSVGFFACIVLPMLVFFVYQVYHLITVAMQLKRMEALEQAEELAKIHPTDEQLRAKEAELEAALAEAQRLRAEMEAKLSGEAANEAGGQAEAETEGRPAVETPNEAGGQNAVETEGRPAVETPSEAGGQNA